MALLESLSNEVLQMVVQYARWDDQFNLAITCKRLHDCATEILQKHRDYHEQFGVVHDIDPLNIITLLRLARQDPLIVWHIRKIEIYWGRDDFKQWTLRTFDFGEYMESIAKRLPYLKLPSISQRSTASIPDPKGQYNDIFQEFFNCLRSFKHLDESFISAEELIYFRQRLESLGLTPIDLDRLMKSLQEGKQAPLMIILITMCSRLHSLVFIEFEDYYSDRPAPLLLLSWLIEQIIAPGSQLVWPMGLINVRHVSVKEHPRPWYKDSGDEGFSNCTDDRSVLLLLLPSLESCSFGELSPSWLEDSWMTSRPELASRVKYLRSGNGEADCCSFLQACPELQSIEISGRKKMEILGKFPERTRLSMRRIECTAVCENGKTILANLFRDMPQLSEIKMTIKSFLSLPMGPSTDSSEDTSRWTPDRYLPPSLQSIQLEPEEYRYYDSWSHGADSDTEDSADSDTEDSADSDAEDSTEADAGADTRADAEATPRAHESEAPRLIQHLLHIASAKPTTLPRLTTLCFRDLSSLTEHNSATMAAMSAPLSELHTLCNTNQIKLHLSTIPSTYCSACDPKRLPFVTSTPRPTGDEFGDLDFTWFTPERCAERLATKSCVEIGRELCEEYTQTWAGPSLFSWESKRKGMAQGRGPGRAYRDEGANIEIGSSPTE